MVVDVDVRWCMVVYGGVWWCMVVYVDVRWYKVVYGAVVVCIGVCRCVFVRYLLKICCKMTIVPFSQQQTQRTPNRETARRRISPKPQ